ncbi:MAG TPA: shikimate dehydrogenase [Pyrinomonadaceae bacterium]|nr:shikimate dehydrogenase [Pyrinomonadaceae bacterium]
MANTGKICISVCAGTVDELFEKIGRAQPLADVIELRFDCLDRSELPRAIERLTSSSVPPENLLATFRSEEQGGSRAISFQDRLDFWNSDFDHSFIAADFEEDIAKEASDWHCDTRLASFHDFSGIPADLPGIRTRLDDARADVSKIAITTRSVTDAIPLWQLLDEGKPLIPIAMGEGGKWTRILGLAHGAPMTYASLESGSETAPGQVSAEDLIEVFRAKELDRDTLVYGIVAGDTAYSISPWMHNAAFKAARMNRVFVPLQSSNLDEFIRRMVKRGTREVELNFAGFSVTNPHKQSIMRQLDEVDETAGVIGAVNTVKIEGERLYGFNTDAPGFITPLKKIYPDLKNASVIVVGAGGAARAVIYALRSEGADVTVLARDTQKAACLADEFGVATRQFNISDLSSEFSGSDILVNTTPLGTKGANETQTIATAEQLNGLKLVYDLVYNPLETQLIRQAKAAGVSVIGGLDMLIAQGAKQFEIWMGEEAPVEAMSIAVKKKLGL